MDILFILGVGVLGLIFGSFANVVIHRLPLMLHHSWRQECVTMLEVAPETVNEGGENVNLLTPRSRCPKCQGQLRAWHNIPVLSYLFLRGRCAYCDTKISIQYPLIELLCGIVFIGCVLAFGLSFKALCACILIFGLICITVIDLHELLIPDVLSYSLLWIGLLISLNHTFVSPPQAIIGAVAGYLSLYCFTKLFYLITGKDGMGHGDFKLFAVLGAWFGPSVLPFIILLAATVGAIIGILVLTLKGKGKDTPLPFGPYLACAGAIALFIGNDVVLWYLKFSGLA